MRNRPAVFELLTFAQAYRDVAAKLAEGFHVNELEQSDPLLAAYDFRPLATAPRPSKAMSLKALATGGWHKPYGYDVKLFVEDCLDYLCWRYRIETGVDITIEEMRVILSAFKHYLDLKEGRIERWKLLKK